MKVKKSRKKSSYSKMTSQFKKEKKRQVHRQLKIGEIVKELRLQKNYSGVDLCNRAPDLDPRTLNAIEMGRITNPTINTLESIASGLNMSVVELLRAIESSREHNLYQGTQKGAYQIQFPKAGIKAISFTPLMDQFFCGKFVLGPKKQLEDTLIQHPYPIYISVLVGRIEATIEKRKLSLKEGENVSFHGALKHRFLNPLRKDSTLMLITAPSIFK